MKFQIDSAKISSVASDRNWGGCFVEDGLIILLEIETDSAILASHLGKSVFDRIIEKYRLFQVFDKNAIKSLLNIFSDNSSVKTAIIGIVSDTSLYLGCHGKGQAVLIRDDEAGTIVSGGFISSGKVSANDRLVFHSDRFAKVVSQKELDNLYRIEDPQKFEEEAASLISAEANISGCAVLDIRLKVKNDNFNPIKFKVNIPEIFNLIKNKFLEFFKNKTPKQKIVFPVLGILLVILIFNIFAGFQRVNNSQKLKVINESLGLVTSQFEEAQSLIELNPVRSRELLSSAKLTVTKLLAQNKKKSREYKLLNDWFEKISSMEIAAYKIYKLTAVPEFFDISFIKNGGKGNIISAYNEEKVILDSANKTVYFLDTKTKEASIIAGSENVKNAQSVAVHGKFAYVLNNEGIYSIEIDKKIAKKVIEKDESWGDIKNMVAFAGNLYLLDSANNAVWKYIATEEGFSGKRNYIGEGVPANFSEINNFAIDGSVYVAGGKDFIKYSQGSLSPFAFKDLGDTITSFDNISTSDAEKNIYILDKSTQRIIVFDKDGIYNSQYQWDDLKNADSIVATEEEGKIYVLIAQKIYAIDIK